MRFFLILAIGLGGGYWWFTHRSATATPDPIAPVTTSVVAQPSAAPAVAPSPAAAPATTAGAHEASWPRRNIDRAQAAVGAAKAQHEGY